MSERDQPTTPGHTPQHDTRLEPQPDPNPNQDEGSSTEFLEQLAGTNVDGTAYFGADQVDELQGVNYTDLYEGDTDVNQKRYEGEAEAYDTLTERELRDGETNDVMEAIQEGVSYIPPIDPPIVPDGSLEDAEVADGRAIQANDPAELADLDDPADQLEANVLGDDEMQARVHRALRADASTSYMLDRLRIHVVNATVVVHGEVDDLDDGDNIVAVISEVPGVDAVRDETTVRGL